MKFTRSLHGVLVLCAGLIGTFSPPDLRAEDPRLDRVILEKIQKLPGLKPYQITVTSGRATRSRREYERSKGEIILDGTVSTKEDLDRVEAVAAATSGVTKVQNNLTIEAVKKVVTEVNVKKVDLTPTDEQVQKDVIAALQGEGVDLTGLVVAVEGGVVTISGKRRNHREIDKVLSDTLMVPGVKNVKSKMHL